MHLPVRSEPATLVRVSAQLHLFDAVEGVFMLQDENVTATVIETGPWECKPPNPHLFTFYEFLTWVLDWLSVTTPEKTWISQQMEAEMNPVFNYVRIREVYVLMPPGAPFIYLELL